MYRKNVAGQFISIAGINATTGAALTGATISMRRCLDGTFAAGGATITEDSTAGFYKVALAQADTNGNNCQYYFTATNMIPVCVNIVTTAGDPTDSVRFGLTAMPNAAAGASGGLLISGSNSGTTTLAALTITGALTVSDGVIITASTTNRPGFQSTGNGIGPGMTLKSGSGGATGAGLSIQSQATNGSGIQAVGAGTGAGMYLLGGEYGLRTAGTVLGVGIASDGEGMQISAANGNGVNVIAAGTDKHGILVTGGSAGTSDGVKLVAGTGGTDLRANVTGNLSGSIGSLGATAKSDVNTEVLDVLNTDTFAEPGQENPPATTTLIKKIGYLYKAWRNKSTQTSTEYKLYADDTTTVDQKATASDDGTTFTRGEAATGP